MTMSKSEQLDDMEVSVLSELDRYGEYTRGWDGYDGEEFTKDIIDRVSSVARFIVSFFRFVDVTPDEIVPGPASDGSVDLEVALGKKHLTLTFSPDCDMVEHYTASYSGSTRFNGVPGVETLTQHLVRLCK